MTFQRVGSTVLYLLLLSDSIVLLWTRAQWQGLSVTEKDHLKQKTCLRKTWRSIGCKWSLKNQIQNRFPQPGHLLQKPKPGWSHCRTGSSVCPFKIQRVGGRVRLVQVTVVLLLVKTSSQSPQTMHLLGEVIPSKGIRVCHQEKIRWSWARKRHCLICLRPFTD
jgi:hypothetical protein